MSARGPALGLLLLLLCLAQVSGRRGPGWAVEDVAGPRVEQGCRPRSESDALAPEGRRRSDRSRGSWSNGGIPGVLPTSLVSF